MAVAGVGVAAAGAVAGPAAVGTEAPVAGQAVVTAGPCHAGLAGTVAGAGVTEGAGTQGEHGRSHGVAGASCKGGTPRGQSICECTTPAPQRCRRCLQNHLSA